jgi:uncharacterized RDD family membrane protein YckC
MEKANRAGLLSRVAAKAVDLILVLAAAEILPKAGFLAGVGYILIGDGFPGGRSLGKRLLGLSVLTDGGKACSVRESILRNLVPAMALLLWRVPFMGWIFTLLGFSFEFIVLLGSPEGKRVGDEMAKTWVAETRFKEEMV